MRAIVSATRRVFDGFFKLDEVDVTFERFDGTMSPRVTRLVFERGDAVGVAVYDYNAQAIVLTEQFRCATMNKGGDGWMLEIVAGMIDGDDTPRATALRELEEEIGYRVSADRLADVGTVFLSPGGSTERIHLFTVVVHDNDRVSSGGGLAAEDEDICVRRFPLVEFSTLSSIGVNDAKSVIALQALLGSSFALM